MTGFKTVGKKCDMGGGGGEGKKMLKKGPVTRDTIYERALTQFMNEVLVGG